jgi:hypothetical protein
MSEQVCFSSYHSQQYHANQGLSSRPLTLRLPNTAPASRTTRGFTAHRQVPPAHTHLRLPSLVMFPQNPPLWQAHQSTTTMALRDRQWLRHILGPERQAVSIYMQTLTKVTVNVANISCRSLPLLTAWCRRRRRCRCRLCSRPIWVPGPMLLTNRIRRHSLSTLKFQQKDAIPICLVLALLPLASRYVCV